jgi:glucokinase
LSIYEHLPNSRPTRILAGDIGGTHSRLAIYCHEAGGLELQRQQTYSSSEHSGLLEVLAVFLENHEKVDAACIGLPAPIHSGLVCPLPNLPWEINREQVLQVVGTDRVALINDVVASAAGIQGLSDDNLTCLHPGVADPDGNRVVVSVGTGLGVSALSPSGRIFATEAGHTTFSPRCELDFKLLARLQSEFGHVIWERVASGPALPRIHAMLASEQSPNLEASEIVNRSDSDPVCRKAVELFRGYIGAAAGNIALNLMASGGLYLTGGVASSVIDVHSIDPFIRSFCDKGRMRSFLEQIPIYIIREDDIALRGAAQTALALLASLRDES